MRKIEGSCLCGSVSYTCSTDPVFTAICNCSACQKLTGSAFIVVVGIGRAGFALSGAEHLRRYEYIGDSGKPAVRHFCGTCGSLVYGESGSRPDMLNVAAGTLHDKSWVKPQMHVYWRDHFEFLSDLSSIPKFELMPPKR